MLIQMLTIKGKFYGQGEYKPLLQDINKQLRNVLYYCPDCGEAWARVNYYNPEKPEKKFLYLAHNLPCGCNAPAAGSLISSYNTAFNNALPRTRDFILYELNRFASNPERYWFCGWNRSAS